MVFEIKKFTMSFSLLFKIKESIYLRPICQFIEIKILLTCISNCYCILSCLMDKFYEVFLGVIKLNISNYSHLLFTINLLIIYKQQMRLMSRSVSSSISTLLLLITFIPCFLAAISSPLAINPTLKFSYTGTQVFPTPTYYGKLVTTVNPLKYSITFPTAMNDTSYRSGVSIQQIYANLNSGRFNISVFLNEKTKPALIFDMYCNVMNRIQTMTIRYLIIASTWAPGKFSFYWFMYPVTTTVSSSSSIAISQPGLSAINMTGPVNTFSVLTGFDVTAQSSTINELSLVLTMQRTRSSSLTGTLTSLSSTPVYVGYISFNQLSYNVGQINAIPGRITFGTFSAINAGALVYTDWTTIVRTYNTMFGLAGFHIINQGFISWSGTVTTNVSITVTSNNNFKYFKFIYLILEEQWCREQVPFLMIATRICYDICPVGYYGNTTSWTCELCLYSCYACTNSTNCSVCNSTTYFRQMNAAISQCPPLPGYYDDGVHQLALPCGLPCVTCSKIATNCTSCSVGYYLSSGICHLCSYTCYSCTTATTCTACNSTVNFRVMNNSTMRCVPMDGYYDDGLSHVLALPCAASCVTCAGSATTCTNCIPGKYYNSGLGLCKPCSTLCLTCTGTSSTCTSCGTGLYVDIYDSCSVLPGYADDWNLNAVVPCDPTCQTCSYWFDSCDSCFLGYYFSPYYCTPCSSHCDNCTSSTVCTICAAGYTLTASKTCTINCPLTYPNCSTCTASVCSTCAAGGYSLNSTQTGCFQVCGDGLRAASEQCDTGASVASGSAGCNASCNFKQGFYCTGSVGSISVCSACMSNCVNCTSATACTLCASFYSYNSTSSVCYVNCTLSPYCLTCNPATNSCLTCSTGYQPNGSGLCATVCGDGILAGSEQCDSGVVGGITGCSGSCMVQSTYYCTSSPSVCSPCEPYCLVCSNATSCTTCDSLAPWNSSNSSCSLNCSLVQYCGSCVLNSSAISCTGCIFGFTLSGSGSCQSVCGQGLVVANQECDAGASNGNGGCSVTCTVQPGYYCSGQPSVCTVCMQYCLACTNASVCLSCDSMTTWDANSSSCFLECSPIQYCTSCAIADYNTSNPANQYLNCTGCMAGFAFDVDYYACVTQCGDGVMAGSEGCDNGAAVGTNGCSTRCTPMPGYFCMGSPSVCSPCSPFCRLCINTTTCIFCEEFYSFNETDNTCYNNCTLSLNCLTCNPENGSCVNCVPGYQLNVSQLCETVCGDGELGGLERCDTGANVTNGTGGCNSSCEIEPAHFCTGSIGIISVCSPCTSNCLNCSSANDCTQCDVYYAYNATNNTCYANCTLPPNCVTCYPANNSCIACMTGYQLNSSVLCDTVCGDGAMGGPEQCDSGVAAGIVGCYANCTIEPVYYCTGSPSVCSPCSPYCLNCTNGTSCITCDSLAPWNSTSSSCTLNCSIVQYCGTCVISPSNSSTISCTGCLAGFSLIANVSCVQICGDGLVVGVEQCDTGASNGNGGCSVTCTTQPGYYCTDVAGQPSVCTPCLQYCLLCSNGSGCTTCDSLTTWNTTNSSCYLDCSIIPYASSCAIANYNASNSTGEFVNCTGCQTGYYVDVGSNSCVTQCGDAIVVGSEQCDNGAGIGTNGCSANCTTMQRYYCLGSPSNCSVCSPYCLTCSSGTVCSLCEPLSLMNTTTNTSCYADCSGISFCATCTIASSGSGNYIQCSTCQPGFSVDNSTNTCLPICGDGIVETGQACDYINVTNTYGCDNNCQVQLYFSCNVSSATNGSQCFLTQFGLTMTGIMKNSGDNSGVMTFQPTPAGLPMYSSLDWSSIITAPNSSVTITSAVYDPNTQQINVGFSYNSNIDASQMSFVLNTSSIPAMANVPPHSVTFNAQSMDNQALAYYSDSDYALSNLVRYIATFVGICAVMFLFLGTFAGRLIGLECSGVIQLSYISLLTLQGISPTFNSLYFLRLSMGYNQLRPYSYTQSIDLPYKSAQLNQQYIYNYNMMGILAILPLIVAVVCKVIAKFSSDKQKQDSWNQRAKYCVGQFTLYALLSFAYLAYLSLFIQLKYMKPQMTDYIGLMIGVVTILAAAFYLFFYSQADSYFTQFKEKFTTDGFGRRFYVFFILQRIIVPGILSVMAGKSIGNGPVIGVYVVLAILLLVKQPYVGNMKNYRPVANCLIVLAVQGIYLCVAFSKQPTGFLAIYGPLAVLGLLAVCIIYSAYALGKQFKEKIEEKCESQQKKMQADDLRDFTAIFLNSSNLNLFKQSILTQSQNTNPDDLNENIDSPSKLNLTDVKNQLQMFKNTKVEQKLSLDQKLNLDQLSEIVQGI